MFNMFISEFFGALTQVVMFGLIPLIWWLITARKKENFFKWLGFRKVEHEGKWSGTIIKTVIAVAVYGTLTLVTVGQLEGVTKAGSAFSGEGAVAIPAVIAYGLIRTALSEEILFRGFILKRVQNKFGFAVGNTVQAILFGLLHGVPFGIASHSVVALVVLTITPAAIGWYMGWLNEKKCGGSIVSSWMMHGIINVIIGCMAL